MLRGPEQNEERQHLILMLLKWNQLPDNLQRVETAAWLKSGLNALLFTAASHKGCNFLLFY